MDAQKKEFIEFLLQSRALRFGEVKLKSGRISPYFVNIGVISDGLGITMLGKKYSNHVPNNTEIIFGPSYKGISLAVSIVGALYKFKGRNVGYAFDRKEIKNYGEATGGDLQKRVLIGSKIKDGSIITLVDDVITDGATKYECINLLRKIADIDINCLIVSVDRQEIDSNLEDAVFRFKKDTGISVKPIIRTEDIYYYLLEENKNEEAERLVRYLKKYGAIDVKRL